MATITMEMMENNEQLGGNTTKVIFESIEEPVISDELVRLFIRFALACGYTVESVALSLMGCGEEILPPRAYEYKNEEVRDA